MSTRPNIESAARGLMQELSRMPVVDTHEHMMLESEFVEANLDFTHLMDYVGLDIGIAGMKVPPWGAGQKAVREGDSARIKWKRIVPFWDNVKRTVYARGYLRSLELFFGVSDLDERAAVEVSKRIREYQYRGVYEKYLQKKIPYQDNVARWE